MKINIINHILTQFIALRRLHALFSGTPPSNEEPYGEYPLVLNHEDDETPVLLVHAYAYGKYLGRLDVTFDDDGVLTKYDGNPILLDKNVEQGQ